MIHRAKPHRWHDRSDRLWPAEEAPVGQDERPLTVYRTTRAPPPLICFGFVARPSHRGLGRLRLPTIQIAGSGAAIQAAIAQRTTRAPPPLICFSTSARVAMEVSPGVVLARAPWAAP